jgi:hypothetical protein
VKVVDLPKYVMQAFGGNSGKYAGVAEFFEAVAAVDTLAGYLSGPNGDIEPIKYLFFKFFSFFT